MQKNSLYPSGGLAEYKHEVAVIFYGITFTVRLDVVLSCHL